MSERIYTQGADGTLEPLEESPFELEHNLQALIATHPELLGGDQMRPDEPLRWMLITREKGIPNRPGAADHWSVDHLILDQDARPTLVEVKRGNNSEIRRTIVGQMLDYAAHAQQSWTLDALRQTFEARAEERGQDAEEALAQLLGVDTEPDTDVFWERVGTNLAASRLRLLFVSDSIPDELERVVTFLNEQMPNIEVLAVEIKRFKGERSQILVPRVVGKTLSAPRASSGTSRRKLTRESFLEEYSIPRHRQFVEQLMHTAAAQGANISVGTTGVSIRVACKAWSLKYLTVAWLFPPSAGGWSGVTNVTLGEAISSYEPPPVGELKEVLDRWVDTCLALPFGEVIPSQGVRAKTLDYDEAVDNIDEIERILTDVISTLIDLPSTT